MVESRLVGAKGVAEVGETIRLEFLTNASPSLPNVRRHSPRSRYGRYEFATPWNHHRPETLLFSFSRSVRTDKSTGKSKSPLAGARTGLPIGVLQSIRKMFLNDSISDACVSCSGSPERRAAIVLERESVGSRTESHHPTKYHILLSLHLIGVDVAVLNLPRPLWRAHGKSRLFRIRSFEDEYSRRGVVQK